jgi:ABC-type bacteriocin/lantibiotic exporter with double-glycine peptidase domain
LYVLGHNVTEAAIRRVAGTTPKDGTDEKGLIRAINHYGHSTKEFKDQSGKRAWGFIKSSLSRGRPVLLCVDGWGHWVAAVGSLGGKVLVFDPEKIPGKRYKYSGLRVYNEEQLRSRWGFVDDGDTKNTYYSIIITA